MQLIRHLADVAADGQRALAIGTFDGVHRGHAAVLQRLVARARSLPAAPWVALRFAPQLPGLTGLRERLRLLDQHGVACTVVLPQSHSFSDAIVAERIGPRFVVSSRLLSLPSDCGLDLVTPVLADGEPIDASRVRALLARGDLDAVAAQLGRDAGVGGRVVHGFHRGTPLGIPTANLRVRDIVLPPDGVYAVRARVDGSVLRGVTNVGFNPTFGNRTRSVETHILEFEGDLYGRRIEIDFLRRLRGEQKFADVAALLKQIHVDIAVAKRFFASRAI